MNIRKIIREEIDDFQWIHDIKPNKWSVFEEVIKEDPNINISKRDDGSWYNFYDEMGVEYLGWDFFEEYELNKNIKENDMGEFINALEKHIEMTWDYREDKYDKDYMDFMELLGILKKINKQY